MPIDEQVAESNKDASECFLPDWNTVSVDFAKRHKGTILGEYQKLNRLQAIPYTSLYPGDK